MADVMEGLDDIIIPEIMIEGGWSVRDCKTIEDCDDAFAYLIAAVAEIEFQIEIDLTKIPSLQKGPDWAARARHARQYKKAALQVVGQTRSRLNTTNRQARQDRHDQRLLSYIKSVTPAVTYAEWVRGSGVANDETEEAA